MPSARITRVGPPRTPGSLWPSRHRSWLLVGALSAAIFALRLLDSDPPEFWDGLFAIPVVLGARLGGLRVGLPAAGLAIALVGAWAQIRGVHLGLERFVSRTCVFLVAGVIAALPFKRGSAVDEARRGSAVDEAAPDGPETRRSQAVKLAALGTWELDLATNAMTWSSEYHDLYGVDPEVFTSSRSAFQEIVHPDDRAILAEALEGITADGVVTEVRYRIVRPSDGEERCIRSHMRCERDRDGTPITVFGTGQDITDLVMVLSAREREMLMLLAEGLSGEEIAEQLTISPATVRTHINNAMNKLGAHTRGQAIAIALRSDEIGS